MTRLPLILLAFIISTAAWAVNIKNIRQNTLGMSFVYIPAGSFQMGTSKEEAETISFEMDSPDAGKFRDEYPPHTVNISNGFWLQRIEVTQAQWFEVMENKPGPEKYWQDKDWQQLPVVSVNWFMAQRFVEELNKIDMTYRYRLPGEAEWEYAARAGSKGIQPFSVEKLTDYAWFIHSSGDEPHPVATLKPNAWGLYDMLGNVWEWVNDRYGKATYQQGTRTDPAGPKTGSSRVRRGGSYHCPLFQTRPGYRAANPPDTRYSVIGFKVIAEIK